MLLAWIAAMNMSTGVHLGVNRKANLTVAPDCNKLALSHDTTSNRVRAQSSALAEHPNLKSWKYQLGRTPNICITETSSSSKL